MPEKEHGAVADLVEAAREIDRMTLVILSAVNCADKGNLAAVSDALTRQRAALAHQPPVSPAEQVGDWIEWAGGENPVPGTRVQLRWRNGQTWEFNSDDEANVDWAHHVLVAGSDVITYRVLPTPPAEGSGR